jgi:hypothetical protein
LLLDLLLALTGLNVKSPTPDKPIICDQVIKHSILTQPNQQPKTT